MKEKDTIKCEAIFGNERTHRFFGFQFVFVNNEPCEMGIHMLRNLEYEQRMRDINKAQLATIAKIAHALDCDMLDLLEKQHLYGVE